MLQKAIICPDVALSNQGSHTVK